MKINFYPVRGCPICYLKSQSTLHFKVEHPMEANDIVHPAGFSRFPYGTHYDPKFIVLNYYDVWFSMDSPEILVTVAHEALHGYHCKNNNHEYCGDISLAKDGEVEERAKNLVKDFLRENFHMRTKKRKRRKNEAN